MEQENFINIKDKTIDLAKVKRLTVIDCPVYSEYTIFVTDFKEEVGEMIDCEDSEDIAKTFNTIKQELKNYVGKSNNLVYIGYENLDLDNQCEVIRVNEIEDMYIQSAKDSLHNRLGYALHIVFENEVERAFFFVTHIEAERYYNAIDSKISNIKNEEAIRNLMQ